MKTLRQKLSEALPAEEQAVYEQTSLEIRRIFRTRFLIWLGITAGAAVILSVLLRLAAGISPLLITSLVVLAGFIVLWIMLPKTVETCKYQCPAAPQPSPEQVQADQTFCQEMEKLKNERLVLMIGCIFASLFVWLFLMIAGLRAHFIKTRPGTAICAAWHYASHLARKARAFTFYLLPILLMCLYIPLSFQKRGVSIVTKRNTIAQDICNAVQTYQNELEEAGQHPKWETVIAGPGETAEEGSLQFGVQKYASQYLTERFWYAVVTDENGEVREVYCRYYDLTEADLTPPDQQEQQEIASSPAHAREAIGYYQRTGSGTE